MVARGTREKWVVDKEPIALVVIVYSRRLLEDSEQPGHDFAIRFEFIWVNSDERNLYWYFCIFLSQVQSDFVFHPGSLPVLASLKMYFTIGLFAIIQFDWLI